VIELNWTLLMQAANFAVLLLVLNIVLFRPILGVVRARREEIEGSLQRAKNLEGQIEEKMSRYQERLQEARLKGSQEKMKLRQEAALEEGRILGEAQRNASESLHTIKDRVSAEAEKARQDLRRETESLASSIASRVLGRAF
jgi:F-type H+-transporting ATPase subunit b